MATAQRWVCSQARGAYAACVLPRQQVGQESLFSVLWGKNNNIAQENEILGFVK